MSFSFEDTFAINPDVLEQAVDGEAVILNPSTGDVFSLDELSATVWSIMKDVNSFAEIFSLMQEAFDVPEEQLRSDLQSFWRSLIDFGIIELGGH